MLAFHIDLSLFLLIVLGKILHELHFFPDHFLEQLNRFVYYLALPALLITGTSEAEFNWSTTSNMILLFVFGTLGSLIFAWIVSIFLKLPSSKAGAFIQGSFRGNGIFIGFPIIVYTMGSVAEEQAAVMLAPIVILFNLVAVAVLLKCGKLDESKNKPFVFLIEHLFTNPMIVSCLIGLFFNFINFNLPKMIFRPMDALGAAALPLILISIGASLDIKGLKETAAPTIIASVIKITIPPLIGLLLVGFFDLTPIEKMITLIFLGVPTAGTAYVLAEALGCDGPLSGRIVALSTLLSAFTLPWLVAVGM